MPGAMGSGAGSGGGTRAAREAVNLALGLHGIQEAFSLVIVADEEACGEVGSLYIGDGSVERRCFFV